jgi:hypothetical protein
MRHDTTHRIRQVVKKKLNDAIGRMLTTQLRGWPRNARSEIDG